MDDAYPLSSPSGGWLLRTGRLTTFCVCDTHYPVSPFVLRPGQACRPRWLYTETNISNRI